MGKIELYAELLTNIRTVTLVATLQTETNQETRVELSGDGQVLTITHQGMSASLRLPTRMGGGGTAALTLPPNPSKDITLRLRVEEIEAGFLTFEHADENLVPWSATGMEDAVDVMCRGCGRTVIMIKCDDDEETPIIKEWRDLPSENWAEMMDFWHCHRPHEHEHGHGVEPNEAVSRKGYAASNKLIAVQGVVYVGLNYFLLRQKDCENVQVQTTSPGSKESYTLQCTACNANLGLVDAATEGWKLYKWSLSIRTKGLDTQSFPVQKWISTQLLALVESSGVRRFVIESSSTSSTLLSPGLLLWLFTDSLSFSSSHNFWARRDPTRAMKIMWKSVDNARELLDSHQFSYEHVVFPHDVYETLETTLADSALLMPQTARKWQDWRVGLLDRFDWEDIRGSDATILPDPKSPNEELAEKEDDSDEDNRARIRKIEGSAALFE